MFTTTLKSTSTGGALALLLAVCVLSGSAIAGPISYGDFSDIPPGSVEYLDVTEDSGTDDPPLYNEPDISGNLLDFDTSGFVSTASGGPLDITDGQLNFTVTPVAGLGLSSLVFTEGGDFTFVGTGGVGTTVRASLIVSIDILEVNGVTLPSPISIDEIDVFSTDQATSGVGAGFWSNTVLVEFGTVLGPNQLVTRADVAIDNQLVTNSEEDSLAFIAKKDFAVTPGEDPTPFVPEPNSIALLLLSTGIFVVRRS